MHQKIFLIAVLLMTIAQLFITSINAAAIGQSFCKMQTEN